MNLFPTTDYYYNFENINNIEAISNNKLFFYLFDKI